ncbi:DUF1877 family protein [Flavobacterium sp. LC2016-01]|uniref:DUF1877 family protein n=1 Tax=Flavobacterium sp. LC2016-01 TaxID=2675876 RepID=UPI0012BA8D78|nr:DUF1877 family protein [Flavobacterium sp. LC2016-01]MTH15981.1 DUF1877 family protein [Flavobacterium sp. LC2016-01]
MSQSVNLYQISKENFEAFSIHYESFNLDFNENNSSIFDQNFEGLIYLFLAYYDQQMPESLEKLFYPQDFIGEEVDFNNIDFDNIEDFPESTSTYYLNPTAIKEVNTALNTIENNKILDFYNASDFNSNDIYPGVWHNDEREDQAFNKRHLEEGLQLLKETISQAHSNENYILFFTD